MKIISKYKDYYDREVKYFGLDPTRVYDRRGKNDNHPSKGGEFYIQAYPRYCSYSRNVNEYGSICICGDVYPYATINNRISFQDDNVLKNGQYYNKGFFDQRYLKTDANILFRSPVLCFDIGIRRGLEDICSETVEKLNPKIPILENFGFMKIMDSRTLYSKIYDFLGWLKDNPAISNNQTDKEKVVSHGFDIKTSFRPKIKKD